MPSRRELVLGGAAAVVLAGCGDEDPPPRNAGGLGAGDEAIVAFALQLELLERDLYAAILRRKALRGEERRMAERFGAQEAEHADALAAVLGRERVTVPEPLPIDVERLAAGGRRATLRLLADIESLGADAYLGAAPEVLDRDALALALSIHSVEARHASAFARLLGRRASPSGAFADPLTVPAAQQRLAAIVRERGAGA